MLSMEFIPTSPTDQEDNITKNISAATNTNIISSSSALKIAPSSITIKPLNYSTVPESIKFIPQPPVQFFYSLQVYILHSVFIYFIVYTLFIDDINLFI